MLKTTPIIRLFYALLFFSGATVYAQEKSAAQIKDLITSYKEDPRGPYYRIKWFCKDGSEREPRDPCPDSIGGGIQHASYKDAVVSLGKTNHVYLGEILAAAKVSDFWDADNNHSRLKQYIAGKYLASVDDGWVLQKAQYYRGALQSEDEQSWGVDFYKSILKNSDLITSKYYLLLQSLKAIPHRGDSDLAQQFRSESKVLADKLSEFMSLRIKIHGQPDAGDAREVQKFVAKNGNLIDKNNLRPEFTKLIETLNAYYAPFDSKALDQDTKTLRADNPVRSIFEGIAVQMKKVKDVCELIQIVSSELYQVRTTLDANRTMSATDRLTTLDLVNTLEKWLLVESASWKPETLTELLQKINALAYTAVATGQIEIWEWETVAPQLTVPNKNSSLTELENYAATARSLVEWSAAMANATFGDVVVKYSVFEPKVEGLIDDRIRVSATLQLGQAVSQLSEFVTTTSKASNDVLDLKDQTSFRGLNPGYATGELIVVSGNPDEVTVDPTKIYIFERPPADLKPVGGIATVSEGNPVSHVQLLARNLGIPNAVLSQSNLESLKKYSGTNIFYAVSTKGRIIMKPVTNMSLVEKALFQKTARSRSKIEIPADAINLTQQNVVDMNEVSAKDSGLLCGPKAANLGQLKQMFPDQVVNGLIIPFGIFRKHMDQKMVGQSVSYWKFLTTMFAEAEKMRSSGTLESKVEKFQLEKLSVLRNAIAKMPLEESFEKDLQDQFQKIFGSALGQTPVFLRSDTNMEDLKEFTGAGLNLTLFNVVDKQKILEGIRSVWASPYTERSFKWRQQYLSNPENVFPSILVIPSVDVDASGVLITKGIKSEKDSDLTIAFSRGAGGAVDGQSAESYLTSSSEVTLLSPSRESTYIRLPKTGGVKRHYATFEKPILSASNQKEIQRIAKAIRTRVPKATNSDYKGAYDVELGFENDKLWLFQIRPFVENKNANSSNYLTGINPPPLNTMTIPLTTKLPFHE